jgi:hypothetical protein
MGRDGQLIGPRQQSPPRPADGMGCKASVISISGMNECPRLWAQSLVFFCSSPCLDQLVMTVLNRPLACLRRSWRRAAPAELEWGACHHSGSTKPDTGTDGKTERETDRPTPLPVCPAVRGRGRVP